MTSNQQQVLELIRKNPSISQKELAEKLNLSRSAVAGYISQLTRKGQILGRAYVLPEQERVICIGALILIRTLSIFGAMDDENTANVKTTESSGGLARTVIEHLVNLGSQASLIAWTGDDYRGEWLLDDARKVGIETGLCMTLKKMQTGSLTRIIERSGKRLMSLNDVDIYNHITFNQLKSRWPHIASSRLVFMDSDLPEEAIGFVIRNCHEKQIDLFLTPSSISKTRRLPFNLTGVKLLFLTLPQLAELTAEPVTDDCFNAAAQQVLARGAESVCLIRQDQAPLLINQHTRKELSLSLQQALDKADGHAGLFAATINKYLSSENTLLPNNTIEVG